MGEVQTHLETLQASQRYSENWDLEKRREILISQLEIHRSVQQLHESIRTLLNVLMNNKHREHTSEGVGSSPWHVVLSVSQIVGCGVASALGALAAVSTQAPGRRQRLMDLANRAPTKPLTVNYEVIWGRAYSTDGRGDDECQDKSFSTAPKRVESSCRESPERIFDRNPNTITDEEIQS